MTDLEAIGEAVDGRDARRARSSRARAARTAIPHEAHCLNCGAAAGRATIAMPADSGRMSTARSRAFWPRSAARRAPFRRQDLADAAAAGLAAGRADPPLHRRRAGALRLADGLFLFSVFLMFAVFSSTVGLALERRLRTRRRNRSCRDRRTSRQDSPSCRPTRRSGRGAHRGEPTSASRRRHSRSAARAINALNGCVEAERERTTMRSPSVATPAGNGSTTPSRSAKRTRAAALQGADQRL